MHNSQQQKISKGYLEVWRAVPPDTRPAGLSRAQPGEARLLAHRNSSRTASNNDTAIGPLDLMLRCKL